MKPKLPCSRCSGTGFDTHEDRHARTRQDVCRACRGDGVVDPYTGTTAAASADPETGLPIGEARASQRPPQRTPGPWVAHLLPTCAVTVRSVHGDKPVAEVWHNGDCPEANGAMVAAAPAMFLALEAFDADLSRTWGAPDSVTAREGMIPSRRAAWHAARAALAAAQPSVQGE